MNRIPAPAVLKDGTLEGYPNCKLGDCDDCHVVSCPIYQGYQQAPSASTSHMIPAPAVLENGTIEGHPNCKPGDCADCHVVWCPIYQGYQEEP